MPVTFRTNKTDREYEEYKKNPNFTNACSLCEKSSRKSFEYWKIVDNSFPYDRIADVHHMITPIRHVTEFELTDLEKEELQKIKMEVVNVDYDTIIEQSYKTRTIPDHYHLHLIIAKRW